jgi:hypothetical protein
MNVVVDHVAGIDQMVALTSVTELAVLRIARPGL